MRPRRQTSLARSTTAASRGSHPLGVPIRFFEKAPRPNPLRELVTGVVCGVRVEAVEEPTMREIRRLDKLVDELAKGRPMDRILRKKEPE